ELSSSHTYRAGGDLEAAPHRGVGLLGVDWTLSNGAWRIAKIIRGAPWDNEVRSPLDEPGVNVHEGDYVLAVNGIPMDPAQDPWAAFGGLADQTVQLTVNDRPGQAGARTVLVKTLPDETRLRNLAWIDANRRRVDEATGGRVGYIYVPNTGTDGQTELCASSWGSSARARSSSMSGSIRAGRFPTGSWSCSIGRSSRGTPYATARTGSGRRRRTSAPR